MQKFAISAAALAMIAASATAAFAGRAPTAEERALIEAALSAEGFTSWKEIEWDDGRWEVDDAVAVDGKVYDLELDETRAIVKRDLDD